MEVENVFKLLSSLVDCLCYFEDMKIVHRNISPESIFEREGNFLLAGFEFCYYKGFRSLSNDINIKNKIYLSPEAYYRD